MHVENPEVARSMVMAIMLGEEGSQLMNTVLLQTGEGERRFQPVGHAAGR